MLKKPKILSIVGSLVVVLCGSWIVFAETAPSLPTEGSALAQHAGSGILDGMIFASELGPVGKPPDVEDNLVFENGMFVSTECERRCDYPPSPYFVRKNGDTVEFISEALCPNKDATIVWRGKVKDGKIEGIATWTTNRWYWTIEKDIAFEGTIKDRRPIVSSAN